VAVIVDIDLPDDVLHIINKLGSVGFEAYAAGGCVRDSLLGKEPQDWDVCTPALPEQIMQVFKEYHIIETGLRHGTVTVILAPGQKPYEITTYRVDGKYKDNRRPENVRFVDVLKRDLARRDFTVNAMAYNPGTGLVDHYGGRQDLTERKIKCVGNPNKRFQEDALRIMRALRFASSLGFSINPDTAEAMRGNKKLLRNISAERIAAEFNRLLTGGGASNILSEYSEIIAEVIPGITGESNIDAVPKDLILRLALLFFDRDAAKDALTRLKYDNATIKAVCELVSYRGEDILPERAHIKRLLGRIGEERFRQLVILKKADEKIPAVSDILNISEEIIAQKQCFLLRDLAVSGKDLIAAGIVSEGVQTGVVLNKLLNMVINEEAENEKPVLLGIAKQIV
jgi:tRNA nucleotidyltransferase (CCA-adding enzyme)